MTNQNIKLEVYWNDLPIGKENAINYGQLCALWDKGERGARAILHDLSLYDSGDNYVLIRSSHGKGFYKTDDITELTAYKNECLRKGKSNFAPVKKINRILNSEENALQYSFINNLKTVRLSRNFYMQDVVNLMKIYDNSFDVPMLSKMENGYCIPTPYQLSKLATIYNIKPNELISIQSNALDIYV